MTRLEALRYCADKKIGPFDNGVTLGPGYVQCELQAIWEGVAEHEPIVAIMALGFDKGEAMKLWNARKSPPLTDAEIEEMKGWYGRLD